MFERKPNKQVAVLRFLVLTCLMLTASCVWPLDLDTVLKQVAVAPPARVGFREERHNPLLKEPLVLTGYLEYLEAGRLRKVIETPFEDAFLIDGEQIELERNGETRKLPLRKIKFLKTMLGGIEAILAGQTDHLASVFRHELSGTDASWSLHLEPISQTASRHLTSLHVKGGEKSINSIRFELRDGEWHFMEIMDADLKP
jgi:hypothetical protein